MYVARVAMELRVHVSWLVVSVWVVSLGFVVQIALRHQSAVGAREAFVMSAGVAPRVSM